MPSVPFPQPDSAACILAVAADTKGLASFLYSTILWYLLELLQSICVFSFIENFRAFLFVCFVDLLEFQEESQENI
jgi:hypothetical protein